jgi:hypothetical protein
VELIDILDSHEGRFAEMIAGRLDTEDCVPQLRASRRVGPRSAPAARQAVKAALTKLGTP